MSPDSKKAFFTLWAFHSTAPVDIVFISVLLDLVVRFYSSVAVLFV